MFDEEQIVSMFAPDFSVRYFDTLQNNDGKVIALYIAQSEEEIPVEIDDPVCVTIGKFGESLRLPFFLIRCGDERQQIMPANHLARDILLKAGILDQTDWTRFVRMCMTAHPQVCNC